VEVLLEVEDEFNHVIPDADADSINSVQEILNYLEKAGVN
jgi:acyl carrier protein